jgi:hypothetical protein
MSYIAVDLILLAVIAGTLFAASISISMTLGRIYDSLKRRNELMSDMIEKKLK